MVHIFDDHISSSWKQCNFTTHARTQKIKITPIEFVRNVYPFCAKHYRSIMVIRSWTSGWWIWNAYAKGHGISSSLSSHFTCCSVSSKAKGGIRSCCPHKLHRRNPLHHRLLHFPASLSNISDSAVCSWERIAYRYYNRYYYYCY